MRTWAARLGYLFVSVLPIVLLTKELSARRLPGRFVYPDYFYLFALLFHLQEGLFVGLTLTLVGLIAVRLANHWLRFAIYFPIVFWIVWLVTWASVRSRLAFQISPSYALALVTHPGAIDAVGLQRVPFYAVVVFSVALMIAVSIFGAWLTRLIRPGFASFCAVLVLAIFLAVHVPVRAYVTHHVNRGQYAVLALDDWAAFPLRTEYLIPAARVGRPTLPNLEDQKRTLAYIEWIKHPLAVEIPRKIDMLWIMVEGFRADAIDEKATPYLWAHANEFQLKLDRNHWSGGNSTQFGLFALFSGLSGYHLQTFMRAGAHLPLFDLLAHNRYRVRIAQGNYFEFGQFLSLFPPSVVIERVRRGAATDRDIQMVNRLLEDMKSRSAHPSCDIVTFDATHWPFSFLPQDKVFEPAIEVSYAHFTRSPADAEQAHNRFRNASRGVDRQIGRIMETLRTKDALKRAAVIVTGDHGEEFLERGQLFHSGAMNDYQGRPVLWMHFPDGTVPAPTSGELTSHLDILPTLLELCGFKEDILRTQGESLLHSPPKRKALLLSEQGYSFPEYHALVTHDYVSRWRNASSLFSFSGVERRDGTSVRGNEWLEQARSFYPDAAGRYETLPDVNAALPPFAAP